jgi:hypothetical protein
LFKLIVFDNSTFECWHHVEVACVASLSQQQNPLPHDTSNKKQYQCKQQITVKASLNHLFKLIL